MTILVVAAYQPRTGAKRDPLDGASGSRIPEWAGIPMRDYLERTTRRNLIGRRSRGERYPIARARRNAARKLSDWRRFETVVLVGSKVATVAEDYLRRRGFPVPRLTYLGSWRYDCTTVWLFPHPLGASHLWPNEQDRCAAQHLFRRILGYDPHGENDAASSK